MIRAIPIATYSVREMAASFGVSPVFSRAVLPQDANVAAAAADAAAVRMARR